MKRESLRLGRFLAGVLLVLSGHRSLGQLVLLSGTNSVGAPGTVGLGWNPSPSAAVTGYLLCWGTASGQCTNLLDAGNVTNATVAGLQAGATYYFTAVAYDALGDDTVPSNEISYSVPLPPRPGLNAALLAGGGSGGPTLQLSFQGNAGVTYEVQATTDFTNWYPLWTNTCAADALVIFAVTNTPDYSSRFFRVILH